ncbi:hypothetical protein RBU61_14000 [Tissierella sp. MB52-C2]|uniref:hypothetical protein n=1 Tax=Tissierella sp. MB52-C2 TaxID=3070999 RepID=UPI00280A8700|nr:hypothetical protein [Tissierella sp. MB52-C2]WMM24028.1 hypothetical protein RBU61_14000 [Tissierella sp. MB52-C2]
MKNENTSQLLKIVFSLKNTSSNSLPLDKFIGLINLTIYDRNLFEKNIEIRDFVKQVFEFEYLDYVYDSRSLISGRVVKDLLDNIYIKKIDLDMYVYNFISFFENNYSYDLKPENIKTNKNRSNNANDKLEKWLKRL